MTAGTQAQLRDLVRALAKAAFLLVLHEEIKKSSKIV